MEKKKAIESAKELLEGAKNNFNIQWHDDSNSQVNFRLQNSLLQKEVYGSLVEEKGQLCVYIHQNNYNLPYIKSKLKQTLSNEGVNISTFGATTTLAQAGDVITTKAFVGQNLNPNQRVSIGFATDVYAINSDLITDCNGQPIGNNFEAEFLNNTQLRCGDQVAPPLTYNKFRLLTLKP